MSKTYSKTRILVECALMIAIGTVLSNIKFFTLPNGGSITLLSMLPFVLVSFRHGVKVGPVHRLSSTPASRCCMGFWAPPTPTFLYFLGEVLLDYVLAFMVLGLAELFARPFKNRTVGVAVGTFAAGFLRFLCSFLSGVLVWGNLTDGLVRLDLQPDLQRQLYAARDPAHHGGRCAVVPRRPADLRPADTPERKFFRRSFFPLGKGISPGGNFCCKKFQKPVDNLPLGWYNYFCRQARHEHSWGISSAGSPSSVLTHPHN